MQAAPVVFPVNLFLSGRHAYALCLTSGGEPYNFAVVADSDTDAQAGATTVAQNIAKQLLGAFSDTSQNVPFISAFVVFDYDSKQPSTATLINFLGTKTLF